jgi:hypothetical protein
VVYVVCATFYLIFGSGERQPWDNPANDNAAVHYYPQNQNDAKETNRMLNQNDRK